MKPVDFFLISLRSNVRNHRKLLFFLLVAPACLYIVFMQSRNSWDDREQAIRTLNGLGAEIEKHTDRNGKLVIESVQFNQPLGIGKNGEGLQALRVFPELVELQIKKCDKLSDKDLVHISQLMNLKILCLDGSHIHDSGLESIKNLTQLEELSLTGIKISDAGLQALAQLKNLKQLDLADNRLTSRGLAHLENLTVMSQLKLPDGMDDEACYYLRKMTFLETLSIPSARLTRQGTGHLSQMNRLEKLVLKDSKMNDDALRPLAQLKSLTSLDLSGTNITDKGVGLLTQVQTLEDLRLDETGVTGQSLNVLTQLRNLRVLYVTALCQFLQA